MRSVFSICPCIQLHKYAYSVSQILHFVACSSRVNIIEPAFYFTTMELLAVSRVGLTSYRISTVMSYSTSLNASLLEVMISPKNELVFISDLSDLTLQIIFDACWASINIGWKRPIAWNNCRYAPSCQFYLHFGIDDSGSTGSIFIVCHQVLRHPSEHGTSPMGKHLLATAHIAKLNELTESDVTEWTGSMVDETALAISRKQGSREISIVSKQKKLIFDIQIWSIWTWLTDKRLQTGSRELWNFRISPRHLESLPHVRFCFSSYSLERYVISPDMTVL